uniref:ZP domain-containing protein n=1 Tax=Monopterus albus TaxID=43700 RepID=A0A3Q3JJ79_MONAL
MRLIILLCQLGLILRTEAQIPDACLTSATYRPPSMWHVFNMFFCDYNSDIIVFCGAQYMDLGIYLCPLYQAMYNESLVVLNNQFNNRQCFGTADWNATGQPLVKFKISLNKTSIFVITEVGSGMFSDYSNIQYVNVSGSINTIDPSVGMITYRPQITYKFSCRYPLQYLLNNTQLDVSGVNVAVKDGNGTFISTLSIQLYKDSTYQQMMLIPPTGLDLKTKIYVAVAATNLSSSFNVLLDRCYTTTVPDPSSPSYYDLFVGCARDPQTTITLNGVTQIAHFTFEAFRFIEHKNLSVSTFYLHCLVRLCDVSTCTSLMPTCGTLRRRRRDTQEGVANATISSPPIMVGKQTGASFVRKPQTKIFLHLIIMTLYTVW